MMSNLEKLGLQIQKETPDGNCWFYAVARQLYGDPSQFQELRNDFANHFDILAKSPEESERFLYPFGKYDTNAKGDIVYAIETIPELNLKEGDPIPALGLYEELLRIPGFRPPSSGSTYPQEVVKAYANSLRRGMYAGDIESTLLHRLYGVTVRIFTRRGSDVVHTRTFNSIPNTAPRPDFYRRCFPPECINLLYNGTNHYDSLIRRTQPQTDPFTKRGMNLNTYTSLKKEASNIGMNVEEYLNQQSRMRSLERNTRRRKKNAVVAAVVQYGNTAGVLNNVAQTNLHILNKQTRNSYLRSLSRRLGMANANALRKKYNETA